MKDREKLFARVKKYCDTHAPSGFEEAAMKLMKEDVKGAQSVEIDKYGNVIATIHGKKEYPKVMICAHIDEPGLIIKAIEDSGYIRFDMLGGMIEQHLGSQRVIIHTENGESITGVIGILPAHLLIPRGPEERYKVQKIGDMYIDVGASSRKEVEDMGINVGNYITYDRSVVPIGKSMNQITGKAFDDRALVVAMLEVFEMLSQNSQFDLTIYAVGSVEEEVGLRGAKTAAYLLEPDLAFVLDITTAKTPDAEYRQAPIIMGKGPAVKYQDFFLGALLGHLPHPRAREILVKTAEEVGIPYQREVISDLGTDAGEIQKSRSGVPTATISLPAKYAHSSIETISLDDLENTIRLLYESLLRVSRDGFDPRRIV